MTFMLRGILSPLWSHQKFLESLLSSLNEGFYPGTIFRPKILQMPFAKMLFSHTRESIDAPLSTKGDSPQSQGLYPKKEPRFYRN
jgi:hypothetical protein